MVGEVTLVAVKSPLYPPALPPSSLYGYSVNPPKKDKESHLFIQNFFSVQERKVLDELADCVLLITL